MQGVDRWRQRQLKWPEMAGSTQPVFGADLRGRSLIYPARFGRLVSWLLLARLVHLLLLTSVTLADEQGRKLKLFSSSVIHKIPSRISSCVTKYPDRFGILSVLKDILKILVDWLFQILRMFSIQIWLYWQKKN